MKHHMNRWDDLQYLKFADERTRPAAELLARVALLLGSETLQHVVDLGCGPGNSTALLQERWPQADIVGVDSSEAMLHRAQTDYPTIKWIKADVAAWQPPQLVDLLFANALLQWMPDHTLLFPALLESVRRGGAFAVQMPCNFDEPSHQLMREIPGSWRERLRSVRPAAPVENARFYYDLLAPRVRHLDIWRTTYEHVMPDTDAIVEWVKGTGLRAYLDALYPDEREPYLASYRSAIEAAYPARSDGKRLFSFHRLFIVAIR